MEKSFTDELRQMLLDEKALLEKELAAFAKKDPNMKGDWDTVFPQMGDGQTGSHSSLEEAADEVEEFENLTSREHVLELRLREVDAALSLFEKGGYGVCKTCGKEIPASRLRANPAAEFDMEHSKE